ncbi:MAG TPA: LysR substrate-binding domain-containing protein, partial [Burkholderiaceae bacterium]
PSWYHFYVFLGNYLNGDLIKATFEANEMTAENYSLGFVARAHLKPMVALEAIESDVIKTYVLLGMGIGIVAEAAVRQDPPGADLAWRPAGHLFGSNLTRVAFKRGAYLRQFVLSFAELLSERLTRALILRAMSGDGVDYDL